LLIFAMGVVRHWGDAMTGRQSAPFVVLGGIAFVRGFFEIPYLNSEPLKKFVLFGQFVIVAIALFYSFYWVWRDEFLEKTALRERLLPTIDIFINQQNRGILEIPARVNTRQVLTKWVQFCVRCATDAPLVDCEAWLVRLARLQDDGTFEDLEPEHIHCRWSMESTHKITIPPQISHHANILILNNQTPTTELQLEPPHIRATEEMQKPGKYKVEIVVTALHASSKEASFTLEWSNYNDMVITQDS